MAMGITIMVIVILLLIAFILVFTRLDKNPMVQQYETSFSLGKVFNIGLKVDKRKTTKRSNNGSLSKP
jgi:hypothetical protein